MTVDTFFEKFELFADAPDAVERLRELVLGLAVQGKLVAQSSNDVPAKTLIEKAIAFSQTLPDAGKRNGLLDEWKSRSTELEGELPQGWEWACNAIVGDTSPRVECDDKKLVAFAPMNLLPTDYRTPFVPETRAWGEIRKGYTHFANGDVAIAKITPCFQNGKGCIFENLPGGVGAGTTELHVLRPYPGVVLPLYALLWFKSPEFVEGGVATFTGTAGQQRVANDYFRFRPFPLPPLAEQKRIVAKVDELMALCDRLEAQQKERETKHAVLARAALARFAEAPTPANLEYLFHNAYTVDPADLRKSILTVAVQGKLVPQEPNDKPADGLLQAVKKELPLLGRKGKRASVAPAVAPFDLPPGWSWCRFPELGVFGRGKSRNRPRNDPKLYVGGIYPLVQTGDVARANGRIRTYTNLYNEVGLAQSKLWPAGTMCSTIAANIADSGILDFEACIPDSVVGFIPSPLIPSVRYFEYFVRTAKDNLEKFAPSTAQKNINLGILEEVLVPLPPAAEQRRIVAKVDALMALVDRLEGQLAESRVVGAKLMEAVVAELTQPASDIDADLPMETVAESDASKPALVEAMPISHGLFGQLEEVQAVAAAKADRRLWD